MYCLTAKGLQRVNDQLEPDFTLYINNNPINTSKYIVSFLSKKVFTVLTLNPTLCSYSIQIKDHSDNNEKDINYLKDIKDLMIGKSIQITKEKAAILEQIGEALENEELISKSVEMILEGEEINEKNCIERIKRKEHNGIDIEEEESYIAKHFSEIEIRDLEELKVDLLEKILNRKDLMIKSEEELIDKIKQMKKEYRILIPAPYESNRIKHHII